MWQTGSSSILGVATLYNNLSRFNLRKYGANPICFNYGLGALYVPFSMMRRSWSLILAIQ